MLSLDRVVCAYGDAHVLHGVSLRVAPGQVLCLLGRNGAGKTTTLRAIMGLLRPRSGRIMIDDEDLTRLPAHRIPRQGVAYVPQGRGLFPFLSVEENLRMGLLVRGGGAAVLDSVFELFPVLKERLTQRAGTLSGGEQQMVATARALCASPRYLLMDEPTEGLAPELIHRMLDTVLGLKARGVGVLLVEQRLDAALKVADTVALLETGHIRYHGTAAAVAGQEAIVLRYLGIRR
ncbi:MAG: ABC transporter ATP-binding protein [Armatimonadota bacterium]|nr:ABC transporter ATP-binding protein [Armatimonadota bacterium]